MRGALIVRGNALALPLPAASVDLIVTSPPYFLQRDYDAGPDQVGAESTPLEYLETLWRVTAEMARVLKPTGSIFINLGDKYNAYNGNRGDGTLQKNRPRPVFPTGAGLDVPTIRNKSTLGLPWAYANGCTGMLAALGGPDPELNLINRGDIVWDKNARPEPGVQDRRWQSHEYWFHLVKQPRYYAAPSQPVGSVWAIGFEPLRLPEWLGVKHDAPFPSEWPRRFVLRWCPPGGTVLDPFGGSGTTAMVARALDRTGISVDLSASYSRAARWRAVHDAGRAIARTNLERQESLL